MLAFLLLDLAAIVCIFKFKLPRPFPWVWAILLAVVLLVGGLMSLGSLNKGYVFTGCLAAIVVGHRAARLGWAARALAIGLAGWVLADSLRLIPSADVVMTTGESFEWVRRPYLLAHPNLVAGWSLLLPFGVWTVITVALTQSRAALAGLMVMGLGRYVPKEWRGFVVIIGGAMLVLAVMLRPGTALARQDFWSEGLQFFSARPLAGWGSGSYELSLANDTAAGREMNATVSERTGMHHSHNAVITLLAENGIVGLIPFVGFWLGVMRLVSRSHHPARWGLLAFGVQQLFDDLLFDPVTAIVLGLCLSVCLFGSTVAAPSRQEAPQQTLGEPQVI